MPIQRKKEEMRKEEWREISPHFDQPLFNGDAHELSSICHAQLLHEAGAMGLDGARRDAETLGYLPIGKAGPHEL